MIGAQFALCHHCISLAAEIADLRAKLKNRNDQILYLEETLSELQTEFREYVELSEIMSPFHRSQLKSNATSVPFSNELFGGAEEDISVRARRISTRLKCIRDGCKRK